MGHIIICNKTDCKYNTCRSCECDIVELDIDGTCMYFEEIDIYKEVEGFSRDEKSTGA